MQAEGAVSPSHDAPGAATADSNGSAQSDAAERAASVDRLDQVLATYDTSGSSHE